MHGINHKITIIMKNIEEKEIFGRTNLRFLRQFEIDNRDIECGVQN
jgi:hypothetical protein